jgi:regulatory protein
VAEPDHVVSALRATKRGRIALHVDGEFVCTVSESLVARHHLFAGKQLTASAFAVVRDEAAADKALAAAYRLLGARSRARRELVSRLVAKGYETLLCERVADRLQAEGLLDDAAFARAFTADKRRLAGWGAARIARELRNLGVAAADIAAATEEPGESSEEQRAAQALRKHGPPRGDLQAAKRRAFALLQRRGFAADIAYRVIQRWASGAGADDGPGT